MCKRYWVLFLYLIGALPLATGFHLAAQALADPLPRATNRLAVLSPTPYSVFQRSLSNTARIRIVGHLEKRVALVEARAALMAPYHEGVDGRSVPFTEIARPGSGAFSGELEIPGGGWYAITVRARDAEGKTVAEGEVTKVGVGEVFVAAGHSFCSNFQADAPGRAADDRVATCADWSDLPSDPPAFRHCDDPLRPGDNNRASPWPAVGDNLVNRLHVPVLIISTGVGGSTVEGWRKGAEEPSAKHTPYRGFRVTLQRITPYTGLRAVLWFGNENDLGKGPTAEQFGENLQKVVEYSRRDSGYAALPWVIAYDAYDPAVVKRVGAEEKQRRKERIDRGTEMVLQTVPYTYDGPQTDDLGPEFRRSDGDHFNEVGVRELGVRFARKIVLAFFPLPAPAPQPASAEAP